MQTTTSPPSVDLSSLVSTLRDHAPAVRQTTADERKEKLQRLVDALLDRRKAFYEALHADYQKSPVEVDLSELTTVTREANHAIGNLDDWMAPDSVSSSILFTGTRAEIHYEPKGVALIMAPWNYPVTLTLSPLVGAIAAGNCAVLKPSEHAPHTADLLQTMISDLYDEQEITVVTGGPEVAQSLTSQPFDHIYFTGSPTIGRKVMSAAAEHLASVTLELGGKSPVLVDETADLDTAAHRIVWSKFLNAGQTCIAPDYVLAHDNIHDALVDEFRSVVHEFYGATPDEQQASSDYARLIHEDHYNRTAQLLTDAQAAGASVPVGGHRDVAENFIAPTVLTEVPLETSIMKDEIFGPLLPVLSFATLSDALDIITDRPAPLSLYVFSDRNSTVDEVLTRTTAGSTCVNEVFIHFMNPRLPFGGKGESGVGRTHGRRTFLEFSNERSVLQRSFGSRFLQPLYPPYGGLTNRIADWLLRYF